LFSTKKAGHCYFRNKVTTNKLAIVGEQFLIKLLKSKSTEQNWVSPSRNPLQELSLSLSLSLS